MTEKTLTPKQRQFCIEYLIDKNATQAAIRAGYSKKTAESIGLQLLRKTMVSDVIQEQLDAQEQSTLITLDRWLLELKRIAFADIKEAYDANGNLLNVPDMPEDIRRTISGFDVGEEKVIKGAETTRVEFTKKIKTTDKIRAMELIAKHFRWIDADNQRQTQPINITLNIVKKYAGEDRDSIGHGTEPETDYRLRLTRTRND